MSDNLTKTAILEDNLEFNLKKQLLMDFKPI